MILSPKQKKFCELYAQSGNATESARMAGYKQPRSMGSENLTKPDIVRYINELSKAASDARIADARERQAWWTEVMRDDTADMGHRLRASEILGRAQGDFIERHEHDVRGQVQVIASKEDLEL